MKIFADHCVHTDVVLALRKRGYKVERAIEVGLHRSSDEEIFNYAIKTKQILLTFDRDFVNIIRFEIGKTTGIIVVEIENLTRETIIKRTLEAVDRLKKRKKKGTLLLVTPISLKFWPKS